MDLEKEEKPVVLFCQFCRGSGKAKNGACKNCRSLGAASFSHGHVLFWRSSLTRYNLILNKTRRVFNAIRFVLFLSAGLVSWLWSFYHYYLDSQFAGLSINFNNASSITKMFFWAGCFFFLYAMYRMTVQQRKIVPVEQYNYEKELRNKQTINSWEEMIKFRRRDRINISGSFTEEALSIIDRAYELADRRSAEYLKPVHLFVALLGSVRIGNTFIRLGIGPKSLIDEMGKLGLVEKEGKRKRTPPALGEDIYQIFFDAYETAFYLHQNYVSVTELLVATVAHSKQLEEILFDLGIDNQKLKNVVAWARIKEKLSRESSNLFRAGRHRSTKGMDRAMTAVATPFLNRLSEDVTLRAQLGRTEACVAREKEIQEIFQIIEGGQNNVLLVGDYGVGRRTIVEGIAERMIEGDVPDRLFDKRLIQLHLSSLLSGTSPSGAIERLVMVFNEISRAGNVILFLHNLHELLGVSAGTGDESLDVASTLSEVLSHGSILVLASTTTEAYAQQINNSKLSSIFTKVEIKETDVNQAIEVLESKVGYIEYKENVFFSYDAIAKSVEYARRYLRDAPLPGSAVEIITEAAVHTHAKKGANALVTGEEVGAVVVEKTHIPLTAISEDEGSKLLQLEQEMHRRVVGQDEAVKLVASALRRARAEIRSQSRPIANFLFLGPTGVGKTELAKTIADVYFGGENRMIRLDMSEYQDKSSIYRLIGQAGSKGSGILTEAIRRQPFGLLLLDEVEKADRDVLNLFLQVMDDGRLTDSTGRVVDFTNVIIIATSNAGTSYVQSEISAGTPSSKIKDNLLHGGLKEYFRPEFLNRFDGIVLFDPISEEAIKKITVLMLRRITSDLEKKG
ncbi:MAG: ATP-dependent Clp protease ATP-binding subunit, partial [Candidatus Magasanikbacteria bacterium]